MTDFRKWFTVLMILAASVGIARANVNPALGSQSADFKCIATAVGIPTPAPEGYTELTGDIVISCTRTSMVISVEVSGGQASSWSLTPRLLAESTGSGMMKITITASQLTDAQTSQLFQYAHGTLTPEADDMAQTVQRATGRK